MKTKSHNAPWSPSTKQYCFELSPECPELHLKSYRSAGKLFHTRGHRKCCGSVVGSMSCQWQKEDFGDHDQQPVGCQQPDTPVSDQTTTDAQDRQSWTRSVVGRAANAAAVVHAWCGSSLLAPVTSRAAAFCTDCCAPRLANNLLFSYNLVHENPL